MAHTPESKLRKYPHIPADHVKHEFFQTPVEPIQSLLDVNPAPVDWCNARILDVGAGRGNLGHYIRQMTGATVDSIEIRAEEKPILSVHSENVWIDDFTHWEPEKGYRPTVVVSNPPFSRAVDIANRTFELFPDVPLIMLQRLEWLGSAKRAPFFNGTPVQALWSLKQRPSFIESGKRDLWTIAWFGWNLPKPSHGIRSI